MICDWDVVKQRLHRYLTNDSTVDSYFHNRTTSPESTIKRLFCYVIILLCQIIYEALEMQILLIKYCDYLSMSNDLCGARETNIVLIVFYTVIM